MTDIPTPETAAFMLEYNRALAAMKTRPSLWDKMGSLERRLSIEKNRANEMGKLAHANACEAMEYRRLLTIAREALRGVHDTSSSSRLRRVAKETLTITAPNQ
jgi:hypothetical protein